MQTQKGAPVPQKTPRFANEAERLKWCRSAAIIGTLAAVNAGCPGAQVRPEPGDCPEDAVKAMKEHGLASWDNVRFTFGGMEQGTLSPPLKSGRVSATVVERLQIEDYSANLPEGTRLFGELWTAPDKDQPDAAALRFERVQLPNGAEFPVCIIANDDGMLGVFERETTGAIRTGPHANGKVVYRWP